MYIDYDADGNSVTTYAYLRTAVMLTVDDSKLLRDFTGKLYPAVAKRFDTTPSAVERGIRHAVNHAHNKSGKRSPSNKEIIATLADDVLMDITAQKRTQVPA
jgi:two-component system response regulator (stage 0 sporulation protein A)